MGRTAAEQTIPIAPAGDLVFYRIVFCLVIIFVASILLDWGKTSMHQEYGFFPSHNGRGEFGFIGTALKNGPRLAAEDFLRGLEVLSFEGSNPRVRFISNLFLLLNVKLRVWLWNYFPPHPSFSLTWIFSLILSPVIFYRLIVSLTDDRSAGWIGLSIYFLSIGFLSGVLHLFHPAKPLANFWTILCFYCLSRIIPRARQEQFLRREIDQSSPRPAPSPIDLRDRDPGEERLRGEGSGRLPELERRRSACSRTIWGYFLAAVMVMCLGLFTDETAWFLFVIVPVLFPAIFRLKGKGAYFALLYAAIVWAFIIFLTMGAPALLEMHGFDNFDFWGWLNNPPASPKAGSFAPTNVIRQGYNFLSGHVVPFTGGSSFAPRRISCYAHLVFLGYFGFLFARLPSGRRWLCLRLLISLAIFLLCQTVLFTRHLLVVPSAWYYGAMFPVFFALLCAVLLSQRQGWLRWTNKIVFAILLSVSAFHAWHPQSANLGLSYRATVAAWKERGNNAVLSEMRRGYPPGTAWLFLELQHTDAPPPDRGGFARLIEQSALFLADGQFEEKLP